MGFSVDWVMDGRAAELSLANGVYDLAILDLGLPQKDGMAYWRPCAPRETTFPC